MAALQPLRAEQVRHAARQHVEVHAAVVVVEEERVVVEQVERVAELEELVVRAQRVHVIPAVQAEVIRDLEHVLIEQIVDRERLVTQRRVRDSVFRDLDRRERPALGFAEVAESIEAGEQTIGPAIGLGVELAGERVQLVVDRVPGVLERDRVFVGTAARVVDADRERVGTQVVHGVEQIVAERELVPLVHVPVQLGDELVVVGLEDVVLECPWIVIVDVDHPLADRFEIGGGDTGDRPAGSFAGPQGREVRARVLAPLALIVREDEDLVAEDRAAQADA